MVLVSSLYPPLALLDQGDDFFTSRPPPGVPLHRLKLPSFRIAPDPQLHVKLDEIQQ